MPTSGSDQDAQPSTLEIAASTTPPLENLNLSFLIEEYWTAVSAHRHVAELPRYKIPNSPTKAAYAETLTIGIRVHSQRLCKGSTKDL